MSQPESSIPTSDLPEVLAIARQRARATAISVFVAFFLTTVKLAVGVWTQSMGVFSDGIHSLLDLVSALVTFVTVRHALKPADEEHPYGHGKFETVSSVVEAALLVLAAAYIGYESIHRIQQPHEIRDGWIGMGVISVSAAMSYVVYRHNARIARQTESRALSVNAFHFLTDVLTSLGVLAGLILVEVTGYSVIDVIVALILAVYITYESIRLMRHALDELVDVQLPREEVVAITEALRVHGKDIIDVHDIRTRRSGAHRHVDCHLVVCGNMSVHQSHEICDRMEENVHRTFPFAEVHVHVEPCEQVAPSCESTCPYQKKGERSS